MLDTVGNELDEHPPPCDPDELAEGRALLRWLADQHFTFLGYREYDLDADGGDVLRSVPGSGLGILRNAAPDARGPSDRAAAGFSRLPAAIRGEGARAHTARPHEGQHPVDGAPADLPRLHRREALRLCRQRHRRAPISRPVHVVGVQLEPDRRSRLATQGHRSDLPRHSSRRPATTSRISSRSSRPTRATTCSKSTRRTSSTSRWESSRCRSAGACRCSCTASSTAASSRVSSSCRAIGTPRRCGQRVAAVLMDVFGASGYEWNTRLSSSVLARLHYVLRVDPRVAGPFRRPRRSQRPRRHRGAGLGRRSSRHAHRRARRRGRARHPPCLVRRVPGFVPRGLRDARRVDRHHRAERAGVDDAPRLAARLAGNTEHLDLKLYGLGEQPSLSDVLPRSTNMGVTVADEHPYAVAPLGIERDGSSTSGCGRSSIRRRAPTTASRTCSSPCWAARPRTTAFNRLVLRAGLSWREVALLRAYSRYIRQVGTPFSQTYIATTLAAHPDLARRLITLFGMRLDPEREIRHAGEADTTASDAVVAEITEELDSVTSLDEDRILRALLHLLLATLRTNYFQTGDDGRARPCLVFKLDPPRVPDLPSPGRCSSCGSTRHASRGAPARRASGARWYPLVGPARGFPHRDSRAHEGPEGQERRHRAVRRQGRLRREAPAGGSRRATRRGRGVLPALHRGLLDVTDNLVTDDTGSQWSPPHEGRALRRRRPLSRRRRRQGHRHVLRHRQRDRVRPRLLARRRVRVGRFGGLRPQGDGHHRPRCVGIGAAPLPPSRRSIPTATTSPWSGSATCRATCSATACCCHRTSARGRVRPPARVPRSRPRAAASWQERKRLFELPRSSWADYDTALISPGGGVYPRTAKSVPVGDEVRRGSASTRRSARARRTS